MRSIEAWVRVIEEIRREGQCHVSRAMGSCGVGSKRMWNNHAHELEQRGLARRVGGVEDERLQGTTELEEVYEAMAQRRIEKLGRIMGRSRDQGRERSLAVCIEEICGRRMNEPDGTVIETTARPGPTEFAAMALEAHREVARGERLACTGRWLRELAGSYAVHPAWAREALEMAFRRGHVRM